MAALEEGGVVNRSALCSTPSLRATAVVAERELQKIRGKLGTTSTSETSQFHRRDMDIPSTVGQRQRQDGDKQEVPKKGWRSAEWSPKASKNKRKKGKRKGSQSRRWACFHMRHEARRHRAGGTA